ncbi:helix-turn-helix domain-containing protein [Pectobacterium brasiliense]|nr:helix-turn-helix domain-containing protein [Pectobacterium brasiliense]
MLKAYGVTMQKQLHDYLDVGNGTVSIWIKKRIL